MKESGSPVLLEHLFRREAGRIVAWLAGLLGSTNLQLAEDAAQEAMLRAAQIWPFQGIPQNPEGWLFRTAHNYAISSVRRDTVFRGKENELVAALETGAQPKLDLDIEQSLRDDELRMVFMCCHPKLAPDAQVALASSL
jgi:RNA polymerase sigma-70 factor (ECF subfamily)